MTSSFVESVACLLKLTARFAAHDCADAAPQPVGTLPRRIVDEKCCCIRNLVGVTRSIGHRRRRAAVDVLVDEPHRAVTHHAMDSAGVSAAGSDDRGNSDSSTDGA